MLQNTLTPEKQDLLITPYLAEGQLPTLLAEALSVSPEGETRDMLLLSLLTNCAYALPAMRMLHGRPHHTYSPELLTMIVAPAASGKGIMNYGRLLLQAIEGNNGKQVYIPANSSASALLKMMDEYDGRGIVFATEMDTLTQTLRAAYGQFGDIVRCIFEHETVSQLRRQNNEFIEIRSPRIAMLLSGTPNQVSPLLRNRENGLMSRFACYVVNNRMDFDDHVWDVEEEGNIPHESMLYDRLATELGDRYLWMETAGHECYFYLTNTQLKTIKRMFRSEYDTYSAEFGDLFDASLKRMPVIMKRIGMILAGLRLDMTKPLPERVVCSEEDFQTMLLIGHKLLMHAAMVFQMMPELKATPMGEIGGNMLQRQFFQMLPTDFTKQDAVKQAEVLGIGYKTIDRWLQKSINCNEIQHVAHGKYCKTIDKIA
ncbi:MAG: DUF3987 domain-containing protein [Paludibacteraceae bacterium]|nr:DUF3987 domain-containing protein [Paludibacteraceae bacterium]